MTFVVRFFLRLVFFITKGENMQKVSYMGDGETTEFSFNFPYFDNTNIVVTKNNTSATGYEIVGTSGGLDADFPYTGGRVVFETAPTSLDSITIARSLPLARIVDYQPLAKLEPTTLNQDANYLMEVIKDLSDELETLKTQYSEIADKESTATLLARITTIHNEIVAVSAQITALGDVSEIRSNITTLDTRTTGLLDYVIASQSPTAENNYTWYRKYKSGWVEQGGYVSMTDATMTINLPVTMSNTSYTLLIFQEKNSDGQNVPGITAKTASSFSINASSTANGGWQVSGNTL